MALRCSGVTRKGTQCSITSCSRLTDECGRLVAEPRRLGGNYCRFHARPALIFFLDLETTGVDVASDQIVETACCHAPSDPRCPGACFSTVVRATAEDTALHVHGIHPSEIAAGPVCGVAWLRFLGFVENLQMATVQDCSDSECDWDEGPPILPSELTKVVLAV